MAGPAPRHLVVDNEAASALQSTRATDPRRAAVVLAVAAAHGRRVAPSAVRCEAGWRRADPTAAEANRLVPDDDVLDRAGADRNVELRRAVPAASLVDAAVVVAAERLPAGDIVEVLTSDVADLTALAGHSTARLRVKRL
jgi:hypothetical protein